MRPIILTTALFATLLMGTIVRAAPTDSPLQVGTRLAAPFVVQDEDGGYAGISIELWRKLAERLDLEYDLQQLPLRELIDGVAAGELDASVAALTVTAGREEAIDFTHPFYTTGLSIAVPHQGNTVWNALRRLASWEFLTALAALAAVLLGVGVLIWLAERRGNPDEFGGSATQGLGSGFWWAAVTMTTVGYGDKSPRTMAGRLVGLVWMFAAIIIVSGFTAAIATSLTVSQLESGVQGVEDLPNVRVATVGDSVSAEFLDSRGVRYERTASLDEALAALARGEVGAVVYDRPLLLYLSNQEYPKRTRVLDQEFDRQDYAIALPAGSGLREAINREMLSILGSNEWTAVLERYLGTQP